MGNIIEKFKQFFSALTIPFKLLVCIGIGLCIIFFFPLIWLVLAGYIVLSIINSFEMEKKIGVIISDPTEENVVDLMNFMNEKIHGLRNHPDSWARIRGLWNVVNRSNKVTTPTKEKFLALLMKYGLVANNKILDNYNLDD